MALGSLPCYTFGMGRPVFVIYLMFCFVVWFLFIIFVEGSRGDEMVLTRLQVPVRAPVGS